MSIYHASTKTISRSSGRTAVASAAYRSGEKLVDERTGNLHDYTRRGGVVHTGILTPDGLGAERNQLWNAAEEAEKRKDSRTAREWVIALPHELSKEQRQALAIEFGQSLVDRYGVAVDVAIHLPDEQGDNRNHHAHVLTTTRQVARGEAGELVMGAKTAIELGDKDRKKAGIEGKSADDITEIRKLWEVMANRALDRAGQEARIDCRSLKAQGLEQEPTVHMGPSATDMERRGIRTDRGDLNRSIEASNDEREQVSADIIVLKEARELKAQAIERARARALEEQRAREEEEERERRELEGEQRQKQRYEQEFRPQVVKDVIAIQGASSRQHAKDLIKKFREDAIEQYANVLKPELVQNFLKNGDYVEKVKNHEQAKQERMAVAEKIREQESKMVEWMQAHPVKLWLHRKGYWKSEDLEGMNGTRKVLVNAHRDAKRLEESQQTIAESHRKVIEAVGGRQAREVSAKLMNDHDGAVKAIKTAWRDGERDDRIDFLEKVHRTHMMGQIYRDSEKNLQDKEVWAQKCQREADLESHKYTSGIAATFQRLTLDALKEAGNDISKVEWGKVEQQTTLQAIAFNGFNGEEVIEVLSNISPTRVTRENREKLESAVRKGAPDLERYYKENEQDKQPIRSRSRDHGIER